MRRIIDIKEILTAAIGVIPDTVVIIIAKMCGCPDWLTLIIGFMPSTLGGKPISMLVEKLIDVGKKFAVIIVTLMLALSGGLLWKFGGEDIWSVLPYYLVPCILISILTSLIVMYQVRKAKKRVAHNFEKTGGEALADIEEAGKIMDDLKGENREITGKYPKENAAVCENGTFVGMRKDGVLSFKGIPYAQAPVGELRWKQPRRVALSEKVIEAYYYGKAEPQPYRNYSEASLYNMSEDCLTLNIWKSAKAPQNCPVTVWLDTLDWCTGGTASPMKDGDEFVRENQDVIFVNPNFRLGLFGNMDFSDIPGGENYQDAKNLGLKDIIEALRWIQRNIAAFGGDPSNVTVVGNIGGGTAAVLLSVNSEAKGLFRRIASFGGSLTFTNDMESFRASQKEAREHLNAKTMDEFLKLPAERLAGVLDELESYNIGFPVADGKTVPLDYRKCFAEASASGIDLLFCIPADEAGLISEVSGDRNSVKEQFSGIIKAAISCLPEQQKQCLEAYIAQHYQADPDSLTSNCRLKTEMYYHYPMLNVCQASSRAGGTGRYLVWDIKSPVEEIGACSLITTAVLRNRKDYYEDCCGVTGDPLVFRAVRRMLVNFAKTGDPSLRYGELTNVGEEIFPAYNDKDGSVTVLTEQGLTQDGGELCRRMKQLEPLDNFLL